MSRREVTIIQRRLTHYRVPLFNALRESLAQVDVDLRLLHGKATSAEATKNDAGNIDWAELLDTRYFAGERLCWQPFAAQVSGSALVIATQENAMLANHLALIRKPAPRFAFWGHGANFQGKAHSLREKYKRWSTQRADWYFAYTSKSVELVQASGFPIERTTQLDNAIDIAEFERDLAAVKATDIAQFAADLGLGGGPVAVFLGSLYAHKRLDFLIAAAERLRAQIDGFQLVIAGDGPERTAVQAAVEKHPWLHWAGSLRGADKARLLRLAQVNMNPGLVGLGILDSFAAGVPLITTDCGLHSPEIAYLTKENGVMTDNDLDSYVAACAHILTDPDAHGRLVQGCHAAAKRYTLPNMVENFTNGVLQALDAPV